MTDESFGFDLPEEKPLGKPTAEDVLRSTLEHAPNGVLPEEWRRAVRELAEKGAVLVENPDGTITLRPREESRWRSSTSPWARCSEGSLAR